MRGDERSNVKIGSAVDVGGIEKGSDEKGDDGRGRDDGDGAEMSHRGTVHWIPGVGAKLDDKEDEIPACFLEGCRGDAVEARRRWQITKEWRQKEGVDKILKERQPHFDLMKEFYPHGIYAKSRKGAIIYIERPGHAKLSQVWKTGVKMEDVERHYTFVTEYLFRVVHDDPDAKIISIFDADGCKLTDLAGDTLKMFQRCSALVGAHYPERTLKIFIVNAPWWFHTAWKIIRPFLDPNTIAKVVVSKSAYGSSVADYLDEDEIPPEVGGKNSMRMADSIYEKEMREWVLELNSA